MIRIHSIGIIAISVSITIAPLCRIFGEIIRHITQWIVAIAITIVIFPLSRIQRERVVLVVYAVTIGIPQCLVCSFLVFFGIAQTIAIIVFILVDISATIAIDIHLGRGGPTYRSSWALVINVRNSIIIIIFILWICASIIVMVASSRTVRTGVYIVAETVVI